MLSELGQQRLLFLALCDYVNDQSKVRMSSSGSAIAVPMQKLISGCQILQTLPQIINADQSGIEPGTSKVVGEVCVRANRALAASLDMAKSLNSRPQGRG